MRERRSQSYRMTRKRWRGPMRSERNRGIATMMLLLSTVMGESSRARKSLSATRIERRVAIDCRSATLGQNGDLVQSENFHAWVADCSFIRTVLFIFCICTSAVLRPDAIICMLRDSHPLTTSSQPLFHIPSCVLVTPAIVILTLHLYSIPLNTLFHFLY